jgi:hypothetical protein
LKILNRQIVGDHTLVLLNFQAVLRKSTSNICEDWFVVSDDHNRLYLKQTFIQDHALSQFVSLRAKDKPPHRVADVAASSFSSREPVLSDGATASFLSSQPHREACPGVRRMARAEAANNERDRVTRYVSLHPVSGYLLQRKAMPPLSPHWKRDHRGRN